MDEVKKISKAVTYEFLGCTDLPEKNGKSAVCIDMTCFQAKFAPGVSEPNAVEGFSLNQMTSIAGRLVLAGHDDVVIISEYNPAIE